MAWSSTTMVLTVMASSVPARGLTCVRPFAFPLRRRSRCGGRGTRRNGEHDGGTAPRCAVDLGPAAETAGAFHQSAHAETGRGGQRARIETGAVVGDLERHLVRGRE